MKITDIMLMETAKKARQSAYAPYSGFLVGAALLCESGEIYEGCNIENASFTPTCCAERVAIYKAVSEGNMSFKAIAVSGHKEGAADLPCYPCGVCRQVLSEFASADLRVLLADNDGIISTTLGGLLPNAFDLEQNEDK